MTPTGRARIEQEVIDTSVLVGTGLKGISAVLGVTERGVIGEAVLVGSWNEYVRHFGGLLPKEVSEFPLYCRRALERGGKLRIARVGHYTDITNKTTLVGVKASKKIENNGKEIKFEANSVGKWGNNVIVKVTPAKNGAANQFDFEISIKGFPDLTEIIPNLNKVLTETDIATFNMKSSYVVLTSTGADVTAGSYQLANGDFDESTITETDYIGDVTAGNGIHVFDNYNDFVKIAIPDQAKPNIDNALIAYVEMRKDCRAVLRTPIGISGTTAITYRDRTGSFSGVAPSTWYADLFFGGIYVIHPTTGEKIHISAIGDILGAMSQRDDKAAEWFAVAGSKRGRIKNVLGVDYNLGSAARATEFDQVSNRGINAVIDDPDFGVVIWDNVTLWKEPTLLKHSNIADLLVYLNRELAPLIKSELFEPNDIETWKAIYRKVRPLLELVKERRGIWDYLYQGDQLIDDIADAQVNTPNNIDAGQYVFNLFIKPKAALKYIGIKVVVANSGVSFEEIINEGTI